MGDNPQLTEKEKRFLEALTVEQAITKILGFKMDKTRGDVTGRLVGKPYSASSNWVQFVDQVTKPNKPKAADGKFITYRHTGKSGYTATGNKDKPWEWHDRQYSIITVRNAFLDDPFANYKAFNSTLDGVTWGDAPNLSPVKTRDAAHTIREAGYRAAEIVTSLTSQINKINTSDSGFSGSAAEACANALKDIRAVFAHVEYTALAGNATIDPNKKNQYTARDLSGALDDYAVGQTKFYLAVEEAWDKWRAQPYHYPWQIVTDIYKKIDEDLTATWDKRTDWNMSVKLDGVPASSNNTADAGFSGVDIGTSAGWEVIDAYAKNVWCNVMETYLDKPIREKAAYLCDAINAASSRFGAISYDPTEDSTKTTPKTNDGTDNKNDKYDPPGYEKPDDPKDSPPGYDPPGYEEPNDPGYQNPNDPGYENPNDPGYDPPGYEDPSDTGYENPNDPGYGSDPTYENPNTSGYGSDGDNSSVYSPLGSWAAPGLGNSDYRSGSSGSGSYYGSDLDDGSDIPESSLFPTALSSDAGESYGSIGGGEAGYGSLNGVDGAAGALPATGDESTLDSTSGMSGGYGGMPMGGMPMGGMGNMGGAGQQEKERERTTWLAEEEDVWGTDPECAPAVLGKWVDAPATTESARPTQQPVRRTQPGQAPTRHQVRGRG